MLFRHTSQYMISSALTAALGFLSAAVFTRLLTPGDYGVYIVGFSMAGFISATLFTWVRYSVMRFEAEGDDADVRMTSLAAYLLSAAAAPLVLLIAKFVSDVSFERAALAVFLALGWSLFDVGQEMLRSKLKVRAFMLGSVLRSALAFAVCIVIAKCGGGGMGQLLGAGVAYYLSSAFSGREIWRGPRAPVDRQKLKLFFKLGLAVTAAAFLITFQATFDRLFIAWRFGDNAAGLYGASADVVRQIILIPAGSVAAAAFPLTVRAFTHGSAADTRKQLENSAELLLAVLAPAAVGLALTAPYLSSFLLGPDFRLTAAAVMPILAFAWLFQSLSQSYIHVSFHLAMRQDLPIPHGLITLAANAALIWPLTSQFGPVGAAWSLLISEIVGAAGGYGLTFWAHPLPLAPSGVWRVATASGGMAVIVYGLEQVFSAYNAASFSLLAATGALVYLGVSLALNVCGSRDYLAQALDKRVERRAARRFAA